MNECRCPFDILGKSPSDVSSVLRIINTHTFIMDLRYYKRISTSGVAKLLLCEPKHALAIPSPIEQSRNVIFPLFIKAHVSVGV